MKPMILKIPTNGQLKTVVMRSQLKSQKIPKPILKENLNTARMKVIMKTRNPKVSRRMSHHLKTRTRKMIVRRKGSLQQENPHQPAEGVDLHLILLLKKAEASAVAVVAA